MDIKVDPRIVQTMDYMSRNFQAYDLLNIAEGVAAIARIMWDPAKIESPRDSKYPLNWTLGGPNNNNPPTQSPAAEHMPREDDEG
jgi:hypothetical protein